MMIIRKAYKYRLNTNKQTESTFFRFSGCCRFVWNRALSETKRDYENYIECKKNLIGLKPPGISGYEFSRKLPKNKKNTKSFLERLCVFIWCGIEDLNPHVNDTRS